MGSQVAGISGVPTRTLPVIATAAEVPTTARLYESVSSWITWLPVTVTTETSATRATTEEFPVSWLSPAISDPAVTLAAEIDALVR